MSVHLSENKVEEADSESFFEEQNSAAIKQLLSSYEIGSKLRSLRLRKKMALIDLGKQTGLSASMLSQLENGKLIPTLPTLVRISSVFDVSLDHFFGNQKQKNTIFIVRANEKGLAQAVPQIQDHWTEFLVVAPRDRSMQAFLLEIAASDIREIQGRNQEGGEFVHVLEGSPIVTYNKESHSLNPGDSVYLDPSEAHSFRNSGPKSARVLVVITPSRS